MKINSGIVFANSDISIQSISSRLSEQGIPTRRISNTEKDQFSMNTLVCMDETSARGLDVSKLEYVLFLENQQPLRRFFIWPEELVEMKILVK